MAKIKVIPAAGRQVEKPSSGRKPVYLKPAGEEVEDSQHWRRREIDGDVTIIDPSAPPPAPAATAPSARPASTPRPAANTSKDKE